MSSLARVQIESARPHIAHARLEASAAFTVEASKGCTPMLSPLPVRLEPPYRHLQIQDDLLSGPTELSPLHDVAPVADLLRYRICISPAEKFAWDRCETFLKQLYSLSGRAGLEIVGNAESMQLLLLCQPQDAALLQCAFESAFRHGSLRPLTGPIWELTAWGSIVFRDYYPPPPYSHLLTQPGELRHSPYEAVFLAMRQIPSPVVGVFQCLFQPVDPDHNWHDNVKLLTDIEFNVRMLRGHQSVFRHPQQTPSGSLLEMAEDVTSKAHDDKPFFAAALRVAILNGPDHADATLETFCSATNLFQHGGRPLQWLDHNDYRHFSHEQLLSWITDAHTYRSGFLLNTRELSGLVHVPPAEFIELQEFPLAMRDEVELPFGALNDGLYVGDFEDAGHRRRVHIPKTARSRHCVIIGHTGQGKSSLMQRCLLDDITAGCGVGLLDHHGDLAQSLLRALPEEAIERTILFAPGDVNWIPLWNPLVLHEGQSPSRVAGELVNAFKSFVKDWGDRLEHFLRAAFFSLLHFPGATLRHAMLALSKDSLIGERLRNELAEQLDGDTAEFWRNIYPKYTRDAAFPPQHKLSKLLLGGPAALMLSQPQCAFNFRDIMDTGKIFIADYSGLDPESRSALGCMQLALIHQAALSRNNVPQDQRKPFYLAIDECHKFVTSSLEEMLVESRKYGVCLTLAHQHLSQFSKSEVDALAGVGATITFCVGSDDAKAQLRRMGGRVSVERLTNLEPFQAILRTSGHVVPIHTRRYVDREDEMVRNRVIENSRRLYTRPADELRLLLDQPYTLSPSDDRPFAQIGPLSRTSNAGESLDYDEFD